MTELSERQCNSDPTFAPKLNANECEDLITAIDHNWRLDLDSQTLSRQFEFKNYYQTFAFANSVAWIAHSQNHHPDMTITYKHCDISYSTHSVGGLSVNDFICAARIDALMQ